MANLPSAYSSQRYGSRTIDFYAVSGEATGADPRARADERRVQDVDGARHTVRLADPAFRIEPGDQAAILRLQPGPARRSRPVAIVNHSRGAWSRTHPGASAVLSRAGVGRNVNWALVVALFALAALAVVWPYLRTFIVELAPAAAAATPSFDMFATLVARVPPLAGFDLVNAAAPVAALLDAARPGLGAQAPLIVFGVGILAGALVVFSARSWRLLWAPAYVAALAAGALGFGGPAAATAPFLASLALATVLFAVAGAINRVRDAARLESGIARLAEHILAHAPEETVRTARAAAPADAMAEAGSEPDLDPEAERGPDSQPARDALVGAGAAAAVAAAFDRLGDETGEGEALTDSDGTPDAANAEGEADGRAEVEAAEADLAQDASLADDAVEADAEADQELASGAEAEADDSDAVQVIETDCTLETVESVDEAADAATETAEPLEAADLTIEGESELSEGDAEAGPSDVIEPAAEEAVAVQTHEADAEAGAEVEAVGDDGAEGEAAKSEAADASADAAALEAAEAEIDAGLAETDLALDGEAGRAEPLPSGGIDMEEAERLRTDPRYAARAITLPPPPPMPGPARSGLHLLTPDRPLEGLAAPSFGATAPAPETEQG